MIFFTTIDILLILIHLIWWYDTFWGKASRVLLPFLISLHYCLFDTLKYWYCYSLHWLLFLIPLVFIILLIYRLHDDDCVLLHSIHSIFTDIVVVFMPDTIVICDVDDVSGKYHFIIFIDSTLFWHYIVLCAHSFRLLTHSDPHSFLIPSFTTIPMILMMEVFDDVRWCSPYSHFIRCLLFTLRYMLGVVLPTIHLVFCCMHFPSLAFCVTLLGITCCIILHDFIDIWYLYWYNLTMCTLPFCMPYFILLFLLFPDMMSVSTW